MVVPVKTIDPQGSVGSGVEQLRRPTNGTIESEKARLRKATKEFESFFVYQMLKTMRQTIPEDGMSGDTPLSGGMGKDVFTEIFDMEIARKANFGGHNSISELLYRSMEKLIDARYEDKPAAPVSRALPPVADPIPKRLKIEIPKPIEKPTLHFQPIKRMKAHLSDPAARSVTAHDPIRAKFGHIIDRVARETKLDSALISSVIQAESGGNPNAVSPAGAKGLMQLADSTAQELHVSDPFDPAENIRAGSRYLRRMLDRFGDLKLALAAYNAGPGNVEKHAGVPPFEETVEYVRRVTESLKLAGAK